MCFFLHIFQQKHPETEPSISYWGKYMNNIYSTWKINNLHCFESFWKGRGDWPWKWLLCHFNTGDSGWDLVKRGCMHLYSEDGWIVTIKWQYMRIYYNNLFILWMFNENLKSLTMPLLPSFCCYFHSPAALPSADTFYTFHCWLI